MRKIKILIDNGHGYDTPGKCSPDGKLKEYKWTREIAARLVRTLTEQGYDAELLVTEEEDISLSERVKRVNEACKKYGVRNVVLISIHCNAAGNGNQWMTARGWEAFTSKGRTRADELATLFYAEVEKMAEHRLRCDNSDGDPDKEAGLYLLNNTQCPAVLTENLFMDNREDAAYLLSEEGKQTIVDIHVNAIKNFL